MEMISLSSRIRKVSGFFAVVIIFCGMASPVEASSSLIASHLFNIPYESIDTGTPDGATSPIGANYAYNSYKQVCDPYKMDCTKKCIGYTAGHSGIDIQTKDVEGPLTAQRNFYAVSNGLVTQAGGGLYNMISVYDNVVGITVNYLHARSVSITKGITIKVGDLLGIQGSTGVGTAEHVHLEVRKGKTTSAACGATTTLDPITNIMPYLRAMNSSPSIIFSDVSRNHWFFKDAEDVYKRGIIKGYADKTFRPENHVNRAEFITMVMRAFFKTKETATPYYVSHLIAANLQRYNNEQIAFWTDSLETAAFLAGSISREEAARILMNAMQISVGQQPIKIADRFSDDATASTYLTPSKVHEAIYAMRREGVFCGYDKNKAFGVGKALKRSEAAVGIIRAKFKLRLCN